jgi:hypothetical protein
MTKRFFTTSLPAGQHSNGEVLNNANKEMLNNSDDLHLNAKYRKININEYLEKYTPETKDFLKDHGLELNLTVESKEHNEGYGIPGFYPGNSKQHFETVNIVPGGKGVDPFSRISNISNSFVEINEYNELMSKHGIDKRGSSQLHLIAKGEHNKAMQQYLNHTKEVLTDLRNDPAQYWKTAYALARRSNVFSALMIQELEPNWHRFMNLKELHILIAKYKKF